MGSTLHDDVGVIEEAERLERLHSSGLLEPTNTDAFDAITRLARTTLKVNAAMVTLVDRDRQLFKSHSGLSGPRAVEGGTDLERSFCKVAVASGQRFIVEDARADPLVRNSPAVIEDGVEAYAGMPLKISTGHIFGTLCVMEEAARVWTDDELKVLEDLAALTVAEIEYQLKVRELAGLETLAQRLPAAVSHLSSAVRSTASLADTPEDPRLPRMAEQSRHRLAAVEILTQDLSEAAASTRSRRPQGPLVVDLAGLVRRTCRIVGSAARPEDLVVETGEQPVWVRWEGADLGQALSLVVMAALHQLGSGGRVVVRLVVEGASAQVSVLSPGHQMPTGELLRAVSGFSTQGAPSYVSSKQRQTTARCGPLTATTSERGSEFTLTLGVDQSPATTLAQV